MLFSIVNNGVVSFVSRKKINSSPATKSAWGLYPNLRTLTQLLMAVNYRQIALIRAVYCVILHL